MKSTRRSRRAKQREAPDEEMEGLRAMFNARLQSERLHFVVQSAQLARADKDPQRIFEDLKFRAHRLHGGAAIFEMAEIAAAADALEQAADAAQTTNADHTDATVWSTLGKLVELIDDLQRSDADAFAEAG
jgi:HPt (histidine-containing phosphotransfer) domain-containing protein